MLLLFRMKRTAGQWSVRRSEEEEEEGEVLKDRVCCFYVKSVEADDASRGGVSWRQTDRSGDKKIKPTEKRFVFQDSITNDLILLTLWSSV